MSIKLNDVDVSDTRVLLGAVLTHLNADENARVQFLCPAGSGNSTMQRVRVMLSRVRNNLKAKNKPIRQFSLHHSVHPYTHEGKRMDCIIVWRSKSVRHIAIESIEEVIKHGHAL